MPLSSTAFGALDRQQEEEEAFLPKVRLALSVLFTKRF